MRKPSVPVTKGLGWVALLALFTSWLAWWPALSAYPHTQVHDAPVYQKAMEVARVTVTRFGEMPLWNPFECGGIPLWDNPQSLTAAPLAYLMYFVGSTATIQIWFFLHSTAGVLCMWALVRSELRLSVAASFIASAAWAYAGVHNQHYTGGEVTFAPFLLFPLGILLWRRAEHSTRAAVWLGLFVGFIMLEGGVYPLPYLATLLACETLFRLWPLSRALPLAKAAAIVGAVAFALAALRFLPVADQLMHHNREIDRDVDAMTWPNLKDVFLARQHARQADGQQYVWPEFGDYFGPMLLLLAFLGVFTLEASETWLFVLFVFSFMLMCGHFASWAPWSILNAHVYPFKQMRVPSRFSYLTTIFLAIFAGLAVDRLPRRFRFSRTSTQRAFAAVLIGLGLIGVGDEISVGTAWVGQAFVGAPQDLVSTPAARLHVGGGRAAFLDTPQSNIIDLGCWDEWTFEHDAPLWSGDVPQARGGSAAVRVLLADRTPNTFTVDVDVKPPPPGGPPGRVLLNSTYDRGWRTDVGEVVRNGKMLAVELPPGTFTVHVHYWPHGLTLGLIISGLTVLVLLGVGALRVRRWWTERRATVAA